MSDLMQTEQERVTILLLFANGAGSEKGARLAPVRDAAALLVQDLDRYRTLAEKLASALALVDETFKRSQASGNFLGDDEHEAWTATTEALAAARAELEGRK